MKLDKQNFKYSITCWLLTKDINQHKEVDLVVYGSKEEPSSEHIKTIETCVNEIEKYIEKAVVYLSKVEKPNREFWLYGIRALDERSYIFSIDLDFDYSIVSILFENYSPYKIEYYENVWEEYDY